MLLFIIVGLTAASLRRYSLRVLLHAYELWAMAAVELIYIIFQIHILCGAYSVLRFAGILQIMFIMSYIPPIIKHSLYRPAFIGAFCVAAGSALNKLAIAANGGVMPVYATLSRLTGYYRENIMTNIDAAHGLLNSSSALPFLCDFIDTGFSVMSVGDILIHSFAAIITYYTVKKLNCGKTQIKSDGENVNG